MPGTPRIVTSCGDAFGRAHSSRSWSKASSRSRPTNGVRWRERSTPGRASGRIASQTLIGSCASAAIGAASRYSIASLVRRNVCSSTMTHVHGRGGRRRAAVLTTSPTAIGSRSDAEAPGVTSASPVATAMRACRPSPCSVNSRGSLSAARTARSGSSSCAAGAPNTAMTVSPMSLLHRPAELLQC